MPRHAVARATQNKPCARRGGHAGSLLHADGQWPPLQTILYVNIFAFLLDFAQDFNRLIDYTLGVGYRVIGFVVKFFVIVHRYHPIHNIATKKSAGAWRILHTPAPLQTEYPNRLAKGN
jgi:hypothetical protein